MDKDSTENYDYTIDVLLEFMKKLPKENVKILNLPRYTLMLRTQAQFQRLLSEYTEDVEVDLSINRDFNMGTITAELEELVVYAPKLFADIVSQADNFEIYPLTNGNLRINITFHSVLKTVM